MSRPPDERNTTLYVTDIGQAGCLLVATMGPNASAAPTSRDLYNAVSDELVSRRAVPVHERAFGCLNARTDTMDARRAAFAERGIDPRSPVTFVEGAPPEGEGLAGVVMHAVSASETSVVTVYEGDTPVGRRWQTRSSECLMVQDVIGAVDGRLGARDEQVREVIRRINRVAVAQGFTYTDVIRTWFYLDDILSWYGDFNRVRSDLYRQLGVMPAPEKPLLLPASTGIGGRHPLGAALLADVLMVKKRDGVPVTRMSNRGQKEAFEYGSAFARASLIEETDARIIHVSGTAAIDEAGRSLYPGDHAGQVAGTLDKLETLLEDAGATLKDVATATVFVVNQTTAAHFSDIAAKRGLAGFPGIVVKADVCRDDLLFEIDAEVVVR